MAAGPVAQIQMRDRFAGSVLGVGRMMEGRDGSLVLWRCVGPLPGWAVVERLIEHQRCPSKKDNVYG